VQLSPPVASGTDSFTTSLSALSSTLLHCASPPPGTVGTWSLDVLQNGVTVDPRTAAAELILHQYDPAAVRVSAVFPPGGIVGLETAVTVHGSGFASYGDGQLVCVVDDATSVSAVLVNRYAQDSTAHPERHLSRTHILSHCPNSINEPTHSCPAYIAFAVGRCFARSRLHSVLELFMWESR
jgi:hypothetical protein